ncbi:MAG: SDR family oxidoreductase [Candidatus Dadabacteria bacterium]|nr:MAG: SDR family oxidoreductase [Candidatus Dadabacteria bacterium]
MTTSPSPSQLYRDGLFEDRVAVVTGGATGIGLAIAEEFVRLGAKVVIASRKMHRLIPAAKGLSRDYDAEVEPFRCNIRERSDCDALMAFAVERFGKVDFLVNNGGGQFLSPAENINEKGWKAVIDTNLNGTWNMCKAAGEAWMYKNGGRIVNIVADMWRGFPGMAHTGASRAGVVNLTMTLAVEWAKYGIQINCVAPGTILSTGAHNYPPGTLESMYVANPLKTMGTCEQVAWGVCFLCSPAGDFMTGATINMDGGASVWNGRWPVPDPGGPPDIPVPPWPEDRWPEFAVDPEEVDG